jgi:hypothetical protein
MPKMPITKSPEPSLRHTVILGPCPGCYAWTLQYDMSRILVDGIDLVTEVEQALQEHLAECAGLQEIVESP